MENEIPERKVYKPQEGKQTDFLKNPADIILYGGSAGSGKSHAILLDLLWYHDIKGYTGIVFRRTSPQITSQGGLWSSSQEMFRDFSGIANQTTLEWKFPSSSSIKFSHMQYEKDMYTHQGAQYTGIYFDELVHFTKEQFFYLLSRNRSMCGIKPYVKATCNPDADSWVKTLVEWYIDSSSGIAIPERSGVIRYFIVRDDKMIWANSEEELSEKYKDCIPKSFTFISASIFDNKKLLEVNPDYLGNLHALPRVERERLLNGNWNIKPSSGLFFQKGYFEIIEAIPKTIQKIRYWDRAATKKTETNNPDFTVGIKLEKDSNNVLYVTDMVRIQDSPLGVQKVIKNTAIQDGVFVRIGIEEDPGQAGVSEADHLCRMLMGFNVKKNRVMKDKVTRASPLSSQAEVGNIKILRAKWNEDFFKELENFPDGAHDDIVDALSGAYFMINAQNYSLEAMTR